MAANSQLYLKRTLTALKRLKKAEVFIRKSSEQFLNSYGRELSIESYISKAAACNFSRGHYRNSPQESSYGFCEIFSRALVNGSIQVLTK